LSSEQDHGCKGAGASGFERCFSFLRRTISTTGSATLRFGHTNCLLVRHFVSCQLSDAKDHGDPNVIRRISRLPIVVDWGQRYYKGRTAGVENRSLVRCPLSVVRCPLQLTTVHGQLTTDTQMPALEDYLASQSARFESELCELLRIPSISAIGEHRGDIERAADWVLGQFKTLGLPGGKNSDAGASAGLRRRIAVRAGCSNHFWSTAITTWQPVESARRMDQRHRPFGADPSRRESFSPRGATPPTRADVQRGTSRAPRPG